MKYIEKLLNGAEVKWMTVEEISKNISSGGTPRSNVAAYYGGNIPWLRTQEVNFREIWDTGIKITEEGLNSSSAKYIPANCIIVAMYGATVGRVGINKIPLTTNQACANIEVNDNIAYYRYIYHYLSSQYEYIKSLGAGSQTNINAGIVKKIKVPIPPLYVQEEIVRILDKFTTLEAELEAELDCRKRQYEYYRNQLLSLDVITRERKLDYVESVPLGKIGEIHMCKRILKEQTKDSGDIPFYKIGTFGKTPNSYISKELFKEYKLKYNYPKIGEVLISASGTIGKAVIFDGEDAYFQDSNIVWIENDESMVLNKYLFYCYQIAKWKIAEGGTIQRLYNDNLKKTMIPVPYFGDNKKSLAEQQRIVSILDKFEALTTSISEGLPKEIALRRKQYEYYRNQLLSFA